MARLALLVRSGPQAGTRIPILAPIVLGRDQADVLIHDQLVSRRHVRVRPLKDALELEDLRSLNGTSVDGAPLQGVRRLVGGEVFCIGETQIEIVVEPGALPGPRDGRSAASGPAAIPAAPAPAPAREDELRPITAVFADVVGSTALGERLGPEEVKELVGGAVTRMSAAVERFGGVVQAYMGDGIAAFFGTPTAHDDDPVRAAHAALRILETVEDYSRQIAETWSITNFNVRVGINSGWVAVGPVGAGAPQFVALGDATNVAARLQSAAQPGTVLVGEATAEQLASHFVLDSVGNLSVKGRTDTVTAWRLVRPRKQETAAPRTRLVGRAGELARLGALVDDLRGGRGQTLLLVGDAGIGKTTLLGELRRLAAGRARWLEGQCVSYGGELLLGPFVELLHGWLGVEDGDSPQAIGTRLRARLATLGGHGGASGALPSLARILSLPVEEAEAEPQPPSLAAAAHEIHRAYVAWLEALAADGPLVVAIEDLHFGDESTAALFEEILPLTERAPVLLVATYRADPGAPAARVRARALRDFGQWVGELRVPPLDDAAAGELLRELLPEGLDEIARSGIIMRAEGNPLYLEQLVRALVEGGGLARRRRGWTFTGGPAVLLPPALETLLVARIDRLPEGARRLAQDAAVLGRAFSLRILVQLAGRPIDDDFAVLLRAEIVRELRRYPELDYTFTHGLLRKAALSTLTETRLRERYAAAGAALEEAAATALDEHLEQLAFYFDRSDDRTKAIHYLERAAARAVRLEAQSQAAVLWQRALAVASEVGAEDVGRRIAERLAGVGAASGVGGAQFDLDTGERR